VRRVLYLISKMTWSQILAFDLYAILCLAFVVHLNLSHLTIAKRGNSASVVSNNKRIAFSFDDAPRGPGAFLELDKRPQILIDAMKNSGIKQVVFFTNPGRISGSPERLASLMAYTNAGHALANHTQSHKSLSSVSPDDFLVDVDKAELWLKQQRNYRPWFRFPELDEGRANKTKRDAVQAGLKSRGLRNGYVTADGWDWFMESRAREAVRDGKIIDKEGLRKLYIETHVESANFSDRLAQRVLGRRPVQMLLLHETDLAALYITDLAKALRDDGWEIVTADAVYNDPMAKLQPKAEFADGTILEMLAWEKGVVGNRWFPRNDRKEAQKLFASYVLHE
jgi:peptidoglycan-N-acetylglucosamine deacetylase